METDAVMHSDEHLLARYANGDRACFETFFSRHWKRVRAYGIKKGLPDQLAEDLVQLSFEKLHRSVTSFDASKGEALRWFFTIVHNACMDLLREHLADQKRRQQFKEQMDPGQADTSLPLQTENLAMSKRVDVSEVIAQLSAGEQRLIHLRFSEDLSFAEIADRTGISQVRLRKQWSRLAKKLRVSQGGPP